jgi:hypothetical protein
MESALASNPTVARRVLLVLVLIVLAWLGWRAVTLGMADFLVRSDPEAAMRWRPEFFEARLRALETGDGTRIAKPDQAGQARRSIRANPLDGRGYWWLSRIAQAAGDEPRAQALASLSGARSPRDLGVQAWLMDRALARGDYAGGIAHIDQMLRVQPELSATLRPAIFQLAIEPGARRELVEVMARHPPWRKELMPILFAQAPESASLFPLVDALRNSPSGLTTQETNDWIDRLAHDHNWGSAYMVWTQSLRPSESLRIGNVFNGGFENEPSLSGFDWRIEKVPGARVSRVESSQPTGGSFALHVEFEDRRVAFQHVRQLLALAPGRYRLQGRAKLDLRTERGLVWTLYCAEDGRTIGETEPLMGRKPWHSFEHEFEVPNRDCGGQWLTLRIPARIPAEQLVGGSAAFDDLKIKALGH